jgi:F-type H+-transporting ATPase subunit a
LSVSVLLICVYYNIKIKGLGGWFHELTTAPFGAHPILWPFNFVFQMIEFASGRGVFASTDPTASLSALVPSC